VLSRKEVRPVGAFCERHLEQPRCRTSRDHPRTLWREEPARIGFLPKLCNESRFGTRKWLGQPGRSAFGSASVAVQSPWCGLPCSSRLVCTELALVPFRGLRILRKPRSDLGSGVLRSARGVRRNAAYGARGMIRLIAYFFHHPFHSEPRTPGVVASFCLSFDVLAGGFFAMSLMRRSGFSSEV
jgi:hypothetical protein